jgi:hypothetical protein
MTPLTSTFRHGIAVALALAASLQATPPQSGLMFDPPAGWVATKPASSMRVAEFTLPKAGKDPEDASLVVYYFGGTGGSVQANLDRWIGQMRQPDGRDSSAVAKSSTFSSKAGLKITLIDIPGTYVAEVTPGSSERFNKPGFRQLAAVVETKDGPYFVKVVGPAATVARWEPEVRAFLASLRR